ncbi:hypothetical protein HerbRD11066_00050 [Herbidospora sp. RD11066]
MSAVASHDSAEGGRAGCGEADQGTAANVDLAGGPESTSAGTRHRADVGDMTSEDQVIAAYARSIVAAAGPLSDDAVDRLAALLGYR